MVVGCWGPLRDFGGGGGFGPRRGGKSIRVYGSVTRISIASHSVSGGESVLLEGWNGVPVGEPSGPGHLNFNFYFHGSLCLV